MNTPKLAYPSLTTLAFLGLILQFGGCGAAPQPHHKPIKFSVMGVSLGDPIESVIKKGFEESEYDKCYERTIELGSGSYTVEVEHLDGVVERIGFKAEDVEAIENELVENFGKPHDVLAMSNPTWKWDTTDEMRFFYSMGDGHGSYATKKYYSYIEAKRDEQKVLSLIHI